MVKIVVENGKVTVASEEGKALISIGGEKKVIEEEEIQRDIEHSGKLVFKAEEATVHGNVDASLIEAQNLFVERKINSSNLKATHVTCESADISKIDVNIIESDKIDSSNIDAETIQCKDLDASNVEAGYIKSENVDVSNLDAEEIEVDNLDVSNIDVKKLRNTENSVFLSF